MNNTRDNEVRGCKEERKKDRKKKGRKGDGEADSTARTRRHDTAKHQGEPIEKWGGVGWGGGGTTDQG